MWAAVLVLLSLCSSAQRGGGRERERKEGWWETNKLSVQLLVASNTHNAHCWSFVLNQFTKNTFLIYLWCFLVMQNVLLLFVKV